MNEVNKNPIRLYKAKLALSVVAPSIAAMAFIAAMETIASHANDFSASFGYAIYGFIGGLVIWWFGQLWLAKRLIGATFASERLASATLAYFLGVLIFTVLQSPSLKVSYTAQFATSIISGLTLHALFVVLLITKHKTALYFKRGGIIMLFALCIGLGVITNIQSHNNGESRRINFANELDFTVLVPEKADRDPSISTPSYSNDRFSSIIFNIPSADGGSRVEITETKYRSEVGSLLDNGNCDYVSLASFLQSGISSVNKKQAYCRPEPDTNIWYYDDTARHENDSAYFIEDSTLVFFEIPRFEYDKATALDLIRDVAQNMHPATQSEMKEFLIYY